MAFSIDGQTLEYRKRLSLTIASSISSNETNVPIVVNIPSSDTEFWTAVGTENGGYVRFTDYAGTVLVPEIESYDATGDDAWYHIKVPTVFAAADTNNWVYIYYNNTTGSPIDGSSASAPWDSNYKAVLHHNSDAAGSGLLDSTTNSNDLVKIGAGTPDFIASQIDKGVEFISANSDGYKIADAASMSIDDGASGDLACTLESWVEIASTNTIELLRKYEGSLGANLEYDFFLISGAPMIRFSAGGDINNSIRENADTAITNSAMHHVVFTYTGSGAATGITTYVDGASVATTNGDVGTYTFCADGPGYATIGAGDTGSITYRDGKIDETVFSVGVARSADYVKIRYESGKGTWLSIGGQDTGPVSAVLTAFEPLVSQINRMSRG